MSDGSERDIYDFFHCLLSCRKRWRKIRWKVVAQVLGCGGSTDRKLLEGFYLDHLAGFESWLHDRGPVRVGCIGETVVINILKEFVGLKGKNTELGHIVKKRKGTIGFWEGPQPRPLFRTTERARKAHPELCALSLGVTNPMDNSLRLQDPAAMGFKTNFRSRYLPIDMQEEQEKQERLWGGERDCKTHFIRKKQASTNIKRCCGVTYVVPSESRQEGVSELFAPLPPLAFQIGTLDRCVPSEEKEHYLQQARALAKQLFEQGGLLRATVQRNYGEVELKQFLLKQLLEDEEFLVHDCFELWQLLNKDNFVTLHFNRDENTLLSPALPGTRGEVLIGFLCKKGLCGTRSVKRCLGEPETESDPLNMYASQIRLELYTTKQDWKSATPHTKKLLCALIAEFEMYIQRMLPLWNQLRQELFLNKTPYRRLGLHRWIKSCPCALGPLGRGPASAWHHSSNSPAAVPLYCTSCGCYTTEREYFYLPCFTFLTAAKNSPLPFYLINTRDSFSYDLSVKKSLITVGGREVVKKEFYFTKEDLPNNFKDWERHSEGDWVRVGITTYTGCFSHSTLTALEEQVDTTEKDFLKGQFIESTAQPSFGAGNQLKRTKFFFGSRYMWTACQLAERQAQVAAGVRLDVSSTPVWLKEQIEQPLVAAGVIEQDFVNSIAMNIYHDGKEGLAQHFDDAVRFKQPVFTVKLGSDSRLSFGSQFYGYLNGAFTVSCPRGVVCVMEEFSYAANCAKHCVRPYDLAGRSVTIILRQIHPFIMEEAKKYDSEVDLPTWFSCLSVEEGAVPYHRQKQMEAKQLMKGKTVPRLREVKEALRDLLDTVCASA